MDSVVHFEIPVDDTKRATSFYEEVFGWKLDDYPEMNYVMARTGESDGEGMPTAPGRINGGMFQREGAIDHPVVTVGVDDMDAALERVRAHGGSVVKDGEVVAGMGIAAYVSDSEGNVIGLWQDTSSAT